MDVLKAVDTCLRRYDIREKTLKIKSGYRLSPVRRDWGRLKSSNIVTVILELL